MKPLLIIAAVLLTMSSCYNDKYDKLYAVTPAATTCDTATVSFSRDVMPIITANCNVSGGCHDAAGAATSGYDLTTYANVQLMATDRMIGDINWATGKNPMPKNASKMASCSIDKITAWIHQGTLNN